MFLCVLTFSLLRPFIRQVVIALCLIAAVTYIDPIINPGTLMCHLPYVSSVCKILGHSSSYNATHSALFAGAYERQFNTLDDLLQLTVETSSTLTDDLVAARLAVEDLMIVIKAGPVQRRDIIAEQIGIFVAEAKEVGRDLQKFMMRIYGAVDRVVAENEYTLQRLGSQRPMSLSDYFLCFSTGNRAFAMCSANASTQMAVRASISAFEAATAELIVWATKLEGSLTRIDQHLQTIRDTVAAETSDALAEKDVLLSSMRSMFGGNRLAMAKLRTRFRTLKLVIAYHSNAHRYIVGAQQELRLMDDGLEELRRLCAEHLLTGRDLQLESVVDAISRGLDRLQLGRKATRVGVDGAQTKLKSVELLAIDQ